MVKKAILLLSATAALAGGTAKAQKVCGSTEVYNKNKASDPKVAYYESLLEQQIQRQLNGMDLKKFARVTGATDDTLYDIPLVFHIIHDYGNEYVSDNDVYAAVDDINRYYAKANADTTDVIFPYKGVVPGTQKRYIGKSYMRFHLATKDPSGNPTHGITRRRSYLANDGGDQAKFDQWAPKSYINIWLVNSMPGHSQAAAYAYQPAAAASNPYIDGVISLYSYVYAAAPSSNKATLAHELGHVMNLAHPWGNTNDPAINCGDDGVDDTPPTKGHNPSYCAPGDLADMNCTQTTEAIQKDSIKLRYVPASDTFKNRGISFIAYDTFTLRSVTYYPRNNNDTFKIALIKGSTVIDTFISISNITSSEAQVANLNFPVIKDTVNPYTLVFLKNPGAYHDSVFATYPKTIANTITIQNDITAGRYNYFYNWKVVNSPDSGFIGKPVMAVVPGILTNTGITFNNPTRVVINSVKFYSKDTVGAPYQILLQKKQGAGAYNTVNTFNGNVTITDSVNTANLAFVIPPSAKTDTLRLVFGTNPRAMRDSAANGIYTSKIPGAVSIYQDQDASGKYNYFYNWSLTYGYFKLYTYNQMTALYMQEKIINGVDTLVPAFNVADSTGNSNLYLVDYPDTVNSQNIMDYTYCSRMFTNGQVVRMRAALTSSIANRNNLYSRMNIDTVTGALMPRPDLAPIADFSLSRSSSIGEKIRADKAFGCADGSFTFQFRDRSWNDTITARSWTFSNGATLATSTDSIVNNKFTQPGWVTASLTVTGNNNGGVTGSITRTQAVYAADTTPVNADGYYQEFNSGSTDNWPIFNYYNNNTKWELMTGTGFYDHTSIRYNNFDSRAGIAQNEAIGTPRGDYDDFFTPAFDLTNPKFSSNCNFTFMSAGAFRTNNPVDMRDTLEIWYSTDCGNNWKQLATFGKFKIANNGTISVPFVPAAYSDWTQQGVVIPTAAKTRKTFFRIRYRPGVFDSYGTYLYDSLIGSGNHFYMDRINISSFPLGVNETELAQNGVSLAPNPTSGSTSVVLKGGNGTAMIQVTDIAGKVVYATQQELNGSLTRIEIPGNNISVKGIYLVHVVTDNLNKTEKLVVY
ncbi:M43 family zinc metalloprotease [Chitinophagaceae bacterium MMS25-I14]